MASTRLRPVLAALLLALAAAAPAAAQPTDLLLTEYIEGSGNNKAVEIYNGTGAAVDLGLGGYQLQVYFNGNPAPGLTLNPTGVLASGDVYVIAASAADPAILAVADLTTGAGLWNGNDAVVLRKAGAVVDSLGQAGFNPGTEWGTGDTSTADNTLRRKASVCTGDTVETDPFDPAIEWDGFPNNTFGGLGAHSVSCGGPPPPPPPPPPAGMVINEIHADPDAAQGDANGDGTVDTGQDEFVEIVNDTGADQNLSGWTLSDAVGVRHTFPAGTVVTAGCGIVVFAGGSPTGSFGGVVVQTASTNQLGLNNAGDTVTLRDGGATTVATVSYGGEGGDNQSLTRVPDVTGATPLVRHSLAAGSGGTLYSPGTRVDGTSFAGCTGPPPPPVAEIFEIQGPGLTSPFVNQVVTTPGNVVTALASNGFFMQTPDGRADADAETSNGIFVFTGAAPSVAVGDLVDVTGRVVEFFDFTEFSNGPAVTFVSAGNPLPATVAFDAATPSPDQPRPATEMERYEGMLVSVTGGRIASGNQRFGTDPIAESFAVAGPDRPFREPGILFPGQPGLPVFDGNPEKFELDPDRLGLPNQVLTGGSSFDAEGVVGFEFNGYELWPFSLTVVPAPLPVAVSARQPGEITVGSLNVFRLFDDVDDPGPQDDGAVVSAAEYQRRLDKFSLFVRDVMGSPDVLAIQEAEALDVLEALAAEIAADDPGVVYTAYLVEGNDVGGIDTGFMVRDTVDVLAVTQLAAGEILSVDGSLLHDRPPLLLEAEYTAGGGTFPLTVLALHQRSLGGIDDPVDGPRVRQKRLEQAQSVATIVQDLQTADPGVHLAVIGDFNAFEFSDGYVDVVGQIAGDFDPAENQLSGPDLVDPNLAKLTLGVAPDQRYSFNFGGDAQAIDHALTSQALTPKVTSVEYARGNSDAAADLIFDDSTPLRSSDHDGLVVFVQTDADGDGVPDPADLCPATAIPEAVPTVRLLPLHYALVDGDGTFDTRWPPFGGVVPSEFTIEHTGGCSCDQIIAELGLGNGHRKFGCNLAVMGYWIYTVNH